MKGQIAIKRALISVSDKTGLIELAAALAEAGVQIVSTGSTAKQIAAAGIAVSEVSEVTGFPESLDGRVKTLHPAIHGGLLADMRLDSHREQLETLGIEPFELVVVNLYPFVETVSSGAGYEESVEQIDIGGPAMVRASAKNHANVAIVVSPERYSEVISAVKAGGTSLELRKELAFEAFSHTASYDAAVSSWLAGQLGSDRLALSYNKIGDLRYGENSHQQAALYVDGSAGVAGAKLLGGKEMSYNNFVDIDAAVRAAYDFTEPAVAIIKHANPCGVAVSEHGAKDPISSAYRRAHLTDPVSAFGGVVAANLDVTP